MAASKETLSSLDDRTREVVTCLTRGIRLGVGTVCGACVTASVLTKDISQKNPCSIFSPDTPLRRLLPLFASGVHRVVVSSDPPRLLEASALLAHLTRLPPPMFRLCLSEVDVPLHRFVSLPINASVLDAMQVMSLNGLGAIGVVTGDSERDGELSSLVGVVTVADCSKVVVPSEGKQALGMGLGDMCKKVLSGHHGGRERGEERVPGMSQRVNTADNGSAHYNSKHIDFACREPHIGYILITRFLANSPRGFSPVVPRIVLRTAAHFPRRISVFQLRGTSQSAVDSAIIPIRHIHIGHLVLPGACLSTQAFSNRSRDGRRILGHAPR